MHNSKINVIIFTTLRNKKESVFFFCLGVAVAKQKSFGETGTKVDSGFSIV